MTLEQAQQVMRRATTPVLKTGKDGHFRYDEPPEAELIEAFKVLKQDDLVTTR